MRPLRRHFPLLAGWMLAVLAGTARADLITQWNFNSNPPDASTATGSLTPSTGAGTVSVVGGVAAPVFFSGAGSSDPDTADDSGVSTTTFPAQGAGNETAGFQFLVSTAGFTGITVTWDERHSNTASRYIRLQYTTNGSIWTNHDNGNAATSGLYDFSPGSVFVNNQVADLSLVSGVNDNPSFGIRLVAAFAPSASAYEAAASGSTYGTTGTMRLDMFTVSGTVVPEPGTGALLLGGLALAAVRRRAS